jgi:uncharacterized membrane protein YgcG
MVCAADAPIACRFAALREAHADALASAARTTTLTPLQAWAASPTLSAFLLVLLALLALLYALASRLDALSRRLFHQSLLADRDLRALAHCQAAQGHTFVYDRLLDTQEEVQGVEAAAQAAAAESAAVEREEAEEAEGAGTPPPPPPLLLPAGAPALAVLHPVLRHASPPQEACLFREHCPTAQEARAQSWVAQPSHGTWHARAYALRFFLLRYALLRIYFTHPLLSPFTTFGAAAARVNRLASALASLLLSFWAGAALHSLKSGGVGVPVPPAATAAEAALPLLLFTLISIPAQQLVMAALGQVIAAAEARAFTHRYPFLALEADRREAVERTLALLEPSDLQAALKSVPAGAGAGAGAALASGLSGSASSASGGSSGGGGGEEGGTTTTPATTTTTTTTTFRTQRLHAAPSLLVLAPPNGLLVRSAAEPHLPPPEAAQHSSKRRLPQSLAWTEEGEGEAEAVVEEGCAGSSKAAAAGTAAAAAPAPATAPAPAAVAPWWQCWGAQSAQALAKQKAAEREAATAAAARAMDAVNERMKALVVMEAAAAAAAGSGSSSSSSSIISSSARRVLAFLQEPQTLLAALYIVLLALFVWYALLFALVQGDGVAADFTTSWVSSQATNLLLIEPAVKLAEALGCYVVWPSLFPRGSTGSPSSSAATEASREAGAGAERDRALMMMRAAGLASSLPPGLAFLAYGLTLASSTASTAVGGAVARAAAAAVKTEECVVLEAAVAAARASAPPLSRRARRHLVVRQHVQERVAAAAAVAAAAVAAAAAAAEPAEVEVEVVEAAAPGAAPPPPPPPPPPPHLATSAAAGLDGNEGVGGGSGGGGGGGGSGGTGAQEQP